MKGVIGTLETVNRSQAIQETSNPRLILTPLINENQAPLLEVVLVEVEEGITKATDQAIEVPLSCLTPFLLRRERRRKPKPPLPPRKNFSR